MPAKASRKSSWASVAIVLFLLLALLVARTCRHPATTHSTTPTAGNTDTTSQNNGLNRHPSVLNYSTHARCRMDCRHITEAEIKDILQNGTINYKKSDLKAAGCQKRYAVEGTTTDKQRIRLIIAPCQLEATVVTVIDIGKEWPCNCE